MNATRPSFSRRASDSTRNRAELQQQIWVERIQMLCVHVPTVMVMAVGFAMALGWLLHDKVDPAKVWWWLGMRMLVVVPRYVHARLYMRSASRDDLNWYWSFLALVIVDGVLWGAAWWWLVPVDRLDLTAITLTAILGVAALSAFILHADVTATASHILAMLVPCAVYSLTRQDTYGVFGAISLTAFISLLLLETHRAYVRLVELLTLRFEHERVLSEREQALALAEHHSEAKSRFLASMSHEMRTPLHGILGLSRLLKDDEIRPVALRRLDLLERSSDHLLTVINDVLDVSKIEAGHVQVDRDGFDLPALIDEIAGVSTVTANRKGLQLKLRSELPAGLRVMGDPMRIRQVLHNLLGNAIKFTEQGSVALLVRRLDGGPQVSFVVQDTGIGIPETEQLHIFDAFHQVDNGLGRRHGGTGLGLSISRQLCRAMGGDLRCMSKRGVGSTFECVLLLPEEASANQASLVSALQPHGNGTGRGPAMRPSVAGQVLLVEDNPINALVAEAALRQIGVEVHLLDNGRKALEWLAKHRPDVVLMDCQMPVMDGFEAARLIREQEGRQGVPAVPIIALTANVFPTERQRCEEAGMNDYLGKPFKREDLYAIVMRHLPPQRPTMDAVDKRQPRDDGEHGPAPMVA